jgi:hypothetical protein
MTRKTSARLAGFMFLFYIATAMPATILFDQATRGAGIAAKLAGIALHAPQVRLSIVFSVITIFDALVLGVALYALTRDEDADLAMLALSCRIGEGVIAAIPTLAMVGLLFIATGAAGVVGADAAAASAISTLLLKLRGWATLVSATAFAVGSTIFSWLFLRARSIPLPLAGLGVAASLLVMVALPAELAGYIKSATGWLMWIPMLVFEVTLGIWLLTRGAAAPATR